MSQMMGSDIYSAAHNDTKRVYNVQYARVAETECSIDNAPSAHGGNNGSTVVPRPYKVDRGCIIVTQDFLGGPVFLPAHMWRRRKRKPNFQEYLARLQDDGDSFSALQLRITSWCEKIQAVENDH